MTRVPAIIVIFCCSAFGGQWSGQTTGNYGRLPLSFEANIGQTASTVSFLSRGSNYTLYLTSDGVLLSLHKNDCGECSQPSILRSARSQHAALLGMRLEHSRNNSDNPVGEGQLPGKVHYLIGNDPTEWRTGVPTFSRVRYRGVYPGIDLAYYGNQRQLEYDFVIAPGADPQAIRMRLEGATRLRLSSDGDLVAATSDGSITLRKPVAYQEGNGARRPVDSEFALKADGTVGFRLGMYDRSQPLVIDPVLVFSSFLGGSVNDVVNAIAVDASGSVYVAGSTLSTNFPVTSGVLQNTDNATSGRSTAFVSKLNATGTALVYSTYIGGSSSDATHALAIDSSGDVYFVGATSSKDFPVTPGAFQSSTSGTQNSFVAKLNPTGSALLYATYLGGNSSSYLCCDAAGAVAMDSAGNAYVAGTTYAAGFPVTPGAVQTKIGSGLASNAYVTKLNPTGSALVYSTFLGGSGQGAFSIGPAVFYGDVANALAVDSAGNVYVTGIAHSPNFPVTAGAFQSKNNAATTAGVVSQIPGYNAFVTKINPTGTALVYSTYLGGSGVTIPNGSIGNAIVFGDQANALAVDSSGNVYLAGLAYSADFPTTAGAFQTKLQASQNYQNNFQNLGNNAFVAKLNPTGSGLVYSTFVGGSVSDRANGLAIGGSGNAYITGTTSSTDFPVLSGSFQAVNKGAVTNKTTNAFVSEVNSSGTALIYFTFLGGSGIPANAAGQLSGDTAYGLALDAVGNVYVAGSTWSADFPVTPGAFQINNGAAAAKGGNAFVAKLDLSTSPIEGPPAIRPNLGVVDAASYKTAVAPGGIMTLFGYGLATTTAGGAGMPMATSLGGTQVTIGGVPAPLFYVSPSQINLQVPWELSGQTQAMIALTTPSGSASAQTVSLSAIAPSIFTTNQAGSGQGAVTTATGQIANTANPALRGQYVTIYCLGLGAVSNQPATGAAASVLPMSSTILTPTVTIGGVQASTNFSGLAPGFVGLYQVNALVPTTVSPGIAVPVSLNINGVSSNTVTIAVQ